MCNKEQVKTENEIKKKPIEEFTEEDFKTKSLAELLLMLDPGEDEDKYKDFNPRI